MLNPWWEELSIMFPAIPFVVKLALAGIVFRRLWTTDTFVWFTFLKNSKEDFGVRMWQLLSLAALGIFLLVELPLMASLAALSVTVLADTVVCKLSALNGVVHGMLQVESKD